MKITGGRGVDTAIEAAGVPATFVLCVDIVAPGGTIANVGVHGVKADLHLERPWSQNITITTRLVDTVTKPMLLRTVKAGKIDPKRLITHHFKFDHILDGLRHPRRSHARARAQGDYRAVKRFNNTAGNCKTWSQHEPRP